MEALAYKKGTDLGEPIRRVCEDHTPLVLVGEEDKSVVMISLEDYNAIEETVYLMRNPANAERLLKASEDVKAGKYQERELLDE